MGTMIPRIGRGSRNDIRSMAIHQDTIGVHKAMIRIHRNHRNERPQLVSVERMRELLSGLLQDLLLELLLWEKVILQQVTTRGQVQATMVLEQATMVLEQETMVLGQGEQTRMTREMEQVLGCTSWEGFVQGVGHCVASNCSQGVETKVQVGRFGHREHLEYWTEIGHWEQDLDTGVRGR